MSHTKVIFLKKNSLKFLLACCGFGYFVFFSSLEISPLIRGYIILIPFQIGVLIYYLRHNYKSVDF